MMGRVLINRESDGRGDATEVSNVFIDDYMAEANGAQLKIYLYLLRMMQTNRPTNLSDLAERFNLTESDIKRALSFWEKRGLLSKEYGASGALTSIHIEDIAARDKAGAGEDKASAKKDAEPSDTKNNIPDAESAKAAYNPEKLAAFKEDKSCSQLIFIAEQYLSRPLSVRDMQSLLYIHDSLGFSDALLDYLMQYCVERGKKDFRYMERVALRWRESGYETPEQAKRGAFKYDKRIYEVMDLLGLSNIPTETEAAFVYKWLSDYHLPIDVIREACSRTVLATQNRRLEYADRILTKWHEEGVTKKSDIKRLDDAFEAVKKTAQPTRSPQQTFSAPSRAQRARNYPQRGDYDMNLIEQVLVRN